MRTELDAELRKVSDLYQERCRDYALMVSDECEGEISKQVSGKELELSTFTRVFCDTGRVIRDDFLIQPTTGHITCFLFHPPPPFL